MQSKYKGFRSFWHPHWSPGPGTAISMVDRQGKGHQRAAGPRCSCDSWSQDPLVIIRSLEAKIHLLVVVWLFNGWPQLPAAGPGSHRAMAMWCDIALGVTALGSALLGALLALCRSSSLARPPPPKRSQKLGSPGLGQGVGGVYGSVMERDRERYP